jgi:putative transposase
MEPSLKPPWVGKKTGPNPTDRAKRGTKRVVITEAHGIPVGVSVAGANCNDFKLTRETLEAILVKRPKPTTSHPQGLCVDKGFDYQEVREVAREFGFTLHLPSKGEEALKTKRKARAKARRWVVERNHSWLNRYRGILIRWCKKAENYIGLLHLTFAVIAWRATGLMG